MSTLSQTRIMRCGSETVVATTGWRLYAFAVLMSCLLAAQTLAQGRPNPIAFAKRATWVGLFAATTIWPEAAFTNADAPLIIGVLGKDPFGSNLRMVEE